MMETAEGCPFCPGNEAKTPPETYALRIPPGPPNSKSWKVRVVSNKYPFFRLEGGMAKRGEGMYDVMNNLGAHEIVIETPKHRQTWPQMELSQLENIIKTYRQRSMELRGDNRFKAVFVTRHNRRAAHDYHNSLSHIIAMAVVPRRIADEISGTLDYGRRKDRCIFCDIIYQEQKDKTREIIDTNNFVTFTPFASRYPFETWIIPKSHLPDFGRISDSQISDLAHHLKMIYTKFQKALEDPVISFILHTTPLQEAFREEYHWHIELRPRLERQPAFEWGTGFFINFVAPEKAADILRETK
jgi:UDPglucose--hexose-1-phosphate uridylyltransferase